MLSAVEGGDIRGRTSRKSRGEGKGCAGRPQAATVTKHANPLVSVTDAAARLGIFDQATFATFQRTSRGLLAPSEGNKPTCVPDVFYSGLALAASNAPPFHVSTLPGERSPPGARASLDLIGPLEMPFNDGITYVAVMAGRPRHGLRVGVSPSRPARALLHTAARSVRGATCVKGGLGFSHGAASRPQRQPRPVLSSPSCTGLQGHRR